MRRRSIGSVSLARWRFRARPGESEGKPRGSIAVTLGTITDKMAKEYIVGEKGELLHDEG
jgi:hypothetical protein